MEQIKGELDNILGQLSSVLHSIETQLSVQEREHCFNLFPVSTWTVLPKLLKILHTGTSHDKIRSLQCHSRYTIQPKNGGCCFSVSQNDPLKPREPRRCSSAPPETSDHHQEKYSYSDNTQQMETLRFPSIPPRSGELYSDCSDICSTQRDEPIRLSSASPEKSGHHYEHPSSGSTQENQAIQNPSTSTSSHIRQRELHNDNNQQDGPTESSNASSQDNTQQRDHEEDVQQTQEEEEFILPSWIQRLWQLYSKDPNGFEIGIFQTKCNDPLIDAFNVLGNKNSTEPIYRRFQLLNFYRMTVALDYHTGDRWCRRASTDLARKIIEKGSSGDKDEKSLKVEIEDYCYRGQVCEKLVTKFGGLGYLLVLPQSAIENA